MGAQIGASGSRRGGGRALAEINVTPLVDVMLVLLIISMVAAPMLQRGIHMELPATESASEIREARIEVSIDRELHYYINERRVHPDLLAQRMETLAATNPEETVFLSADRYVDYGDVLTVMDKIRTAGITRISLVTVPLERAPGGR